MKKKEKKTKRTTFGFNFKNGEHPTIAGKADTEQCPQSPIARRRGSIWKQPAEIKTLTRHTATALISPPHPFPKEGEENCARNANSRNVDGGHSHACVVLALRRIHIYHLHSTACSPGNNFTSNRSRCLEKKRKKKQNPLSFRRAASTHPRFCRRIGHCKDRLFFFLPEKPGCHLD